MLSLEAIVSKDLCEICLIEREKYHNTIFLDKINFENLQGISETMSLGHLRKQD